MHMFLFLYALDPQPGLSTDAPPSFEGAIDKRMTIATSSPIRQLLGTTETTPEDPLGIGRFRLSAGPTLSNTWGSNSDDLADSEVVARLNAARSIFSLIPRDAFVWARTCCNPYEDLGSGPFVNRSALKLVNLDHALDLVARSRASVADDDTLGLEDYCFSFLDLCGAPGGFSEYLLWKGHRQGESFRGWAISLGSENGEGRPCQWRVKARAPKYDGESEFNILWGADGTGDLYKPNNVDAVVSTVLAECGRTKDATSDCCGVTLVVADGGFEAARDQDSQESVMHRLIICEACTAVSVLAKGGRYNQLVSCMPITSEADSFVLIQFCR